MPNQLLEWHRDMSASTKNNINSLCPLSFILCFLTLLFNYYSFPLHSSLFLSFSPLSEPLSVYRKDIIIAPGTFTREQNRRENGNFYLITDLSPPAYLIPKLILLLELLCVILLTSRTLEDKDELLMRIQDKNHL